MANPVQRLPKAVSGTPAGIVCVELPVAQGEGETLSTGQQSSLTVSAVYTKLQVSLAASLMCCNRACCLLCCQLHSKITIAIVQ